LICNINNIYFFLFDVSGGVSALGHGSGNCRVKLCSRKYSAAVQQRVDELVLCQGLVGYLTCLRENARSCRGDLGYHTTSRGLAQLAEEYECVQKLASAPSTTEPPPHEEPIPSSVGPGRPTLELTTSEPTVCTYNGPHLNEMRHCGLFGDPHLKTFEGALQTCRVRGAWPLIDSPYLAVQVTNEPVRPGSHATVTTKVRLT
jgi:RGM family protein